MSDKPFFDTNVFVYCFDADGATKRQRSRELVTGACQAGFGAVSYQVIQEFSNVALRRFSRPLEPKDLRRVIAELMEPLDIVHFSMALYDRALNLFERYRASWYDALIMAAAQEARCTVLYSEDLHDGLEIGTLRIENPFKGS